MSNIGAIFHGSAVELLARSFRDIERFQTGITATVTTGVDIVEGNIHRTNKITLPLLSCQEGGNRDER